MKQRTGKKCNDLPANYAAQRTAAGGQTAEGDHCQHRGSSAAEGTGGAEMTDHGAKLVELTARLEMAGRKLEKIKGEAEVTDEKAD